MHDPGCKQECLCDKNYSILQFLRLSFFPDGKDEVVRERRAGDGDWPVNPCFPEPT